MIGCGLLVAKMNDREIKCGQEMLGMIRHCAYCRNLIKSAELTNKEKKE